MEGQHPDLFFELKNRKLIQTYIAICVKLNFENLNRVPLFRSLGSGRNTSCSALGGEFPLFASTASGQFLTQPSDLLYTNLL